jgi:hypothetical protein
VGQQPVQRLYTTARAAQITRLKDPLGPLIEHQAGFEVVLPIKAMSAQQKHDSRSAGFFLPVENAPIHRQSITIQFFTYVMEDRIVFRSSLLLLVLDHNCHLSTKWTVLTLKPKGLGFKVIV